MRIRLALAALTLASALLSAPAAAADPPAPRVAAFVRHALPADLAAHPTLAGRVDFLTLPSGTAPRDPAAARLEAGRLSLLAARLLDAGADPRLEVVRLDRFDPALPTADPARVLAALDGLGFRVAADLREPAAPDPPAALAALDAALARCDRVAFVAPGSDLAGLFPDPATPARVTGEAELAPGPAVAAVEVAALAALERARLAGRGHPDPSASLVRASLLARTEYLAPGRYGLGRGRELAERLSAAARFDRAVRAAGRPPFYYRDERRGAAKRRARLPLPPAGPAPLRVTAALAGAPGLAFRLRRDDGHGVAAEPLPGGRLHRLEATLSPGRSYELVVESPRGARPGPFAVAVHSARTAGPGDSR